MFVCHNRKKKEKVVLVISNNFVSNLCNKYIVYVSQFHKCIKIER